MKKSVTKVPFKVKVAATVKKPTANVPQYEQMHQTLGLAVLTIMMDANVRKQEEHMEFKMRPKQLVNILKRHSDEFVALTLADYDAKGGDWLNTLATQVEACLRAILTLGLSAEHNTEIQQARLSQLLLEIDKLSGSVETRFWNDSQPADKAQAA